MVMWLLDAVIWNIVYGFLSKLVIFIIVVLTILKIIKFVWYYYITLIWTIKDGKLTDLSLPPGTLGYPLIGETVGFVLKNAQFYKERQVKYGRVYKTHVLGRPTIRVSGAENLRTILMGENSLVSPQWPPSVRQILGKESLSMMTGVEHSIRRRIVVKAFDQAALTAYIPYVQEIIRRGLRRWCEKGQILGYSESKTVAFSIAARVFAGLNLSDERSDHLSTVFLQMIAGMFSLPFKFKGSGLYKGLKAKEYLINELDLQFKEIEREGSDQDFCSAVHHLINSQTDGEGDTLSRYAIAEAVLEMLFAGHDTVTSQMCSILMFLGKNKRCIDKLRKELEVEGLLDISDNNSEITLSVLNRLEYLNMVIKETLRLCPPVGAGYRRVLKTFELEGYRIPEGWTLAYGIRDTHLTSSLYTDSDSFNPERWASIPNLDKVGTESKTDRFNFCPFGGGARTCVGKEFAKLALRLFIIELVKTCDWTLLNESAPMKYIPVPRAADNLPLKIHLRT